MDFLKVIVEKAKKKFSSSINEGIMEAQNELLSGWMQIFNTTLQL